VAPTTTPRCPALQGEDVRFVPDSPVEEAGFEPLVPSDARFRGRILSVHPRQRRSRHERESKHEGALRLGGTEGSNLPSSSVESSANLIPRAAIDAAVRHERTTIQLSASTSPRIVAGFRRVDGQARILRNLHVSRDRHVGHCAGSASGHDDIAVDNSIQQADARSVSRP
jgi:hypothetical protein